MAQPKPKPVRTERRKYKRIATDQVISFAPVSDRDLLGVGRDLSSGGIRFEAVGCEIDLGDVIRVTFNVGEHTVVAVGRVVWSTEIDPISSEVGIEFIEIEAAAQQLLDELSLETDLI
jgi:c-di-GMP-binding flagellar brake protein YcgR